LKVQKNEADDRLLVEAAQKEPSRFAELYELHFERVYGFIARHARDRDVAQDLTSEVFHDALANLSRFEWRGVPFSAWLMRIASNALADHYGRVARSQKNSALDGAEAANVIPFNATFEEVDKRARLFRLVKTLPADQRRVIEMRFAEEKSIRDIATVIGRSEGAVKQLQFRALESLRAEMGGKPSKQSPKQPLKKSQQKSGGRNG
jgi:RNA polymerase sigma-70 factor, ECF subfamily